MNKITRCVAVLAVVGLGQAAASLDTLFAVPDNPRATSSKAPWFCHDLECPDFNVKETCDKWEEREYEEVPNTNLRQLQRTTPS